MTCNQMERLEVAVTFGKISKTCGNPGKSTMVFGIYKISRYLRRKLNKTISRKSDLIQKWSHNRKVMGQNGTIGISPNKNGG